MDMMGFIPEDGVSPVSAFSGGWRMRIGLGKILLQDPNILLLDEPTNHLVSCAAMYHIVHEYLLCFLDLQCAHSVSCSAVTADMCSTCTCVAL
jgi:ABC-type nitrate/sulfonate/bicarbonate transport system ATPase subunit